MTRLPTIATLYALHGVAWIANKVLLGSERAARTITGAPDLWFDHDRGQFALPCDACPPGEACAVCQFCENTGWHPLTPRELAELARGPFE